MLRAASRAVHPGGGKGGGREENDQGRADRRATGPARFASGGTRRAGAFRQSGGGDQPLSRVVRGVVPSLSLVGRLGCRTPSDLKPRPVSASRRMGLPGRPAQQDPTTVVGLHTASGRNSGRVSSPGGPGPHGGSEAEFTPRGADSASRIRAGGRRKIHPALGSGPFLRFLSSSGTRLPGRIAKLWPPRGVTAARRPGRQLQSPPRASTFTGRGQKYSGVSARVSRPARAAEFGRPVKKSTTARLGRIVKFRTCGPRI